MVKAYLEISMKISEADRGNAADVYNQYKAPFLETIKGALSKELLVHVEEVQVLHGFDNVENAQEYLLSGLFNNDVVVALKPYLQDSPNIKIYAVA